MGVVSALFPDVPCLALTATASSSDVKVIQDSLGLKNCTVVIGNPDRKNIFYEKVFRHGEDVDFVKSILSPVAHDLLKKKTEYPLTIIYMPLRLCGFAYKLFEFGFGAQQYFPPGSAAIPGNRLFAQFHAPQTAEMKDEILKQLCSGTSTVRVIFATVAIGMGVDIPDIRAIIHVGPPCSVMAYFQETGRGGRDGKQSHAILYYNNRDIAQNRAGMQDDKNFCQSDRVCLRKMLLMSLDFELKISVQPPHNCCSVCKLECKCTKCQELISELDELNI